MMKKYIKKTRILFKKFHLLLKAWVFTPKKFLRIIINVPSFISAKAYAHNYTDMAQISVNIPLSSINPLWEHFRNHHKGDGIHKWEHYFDIYHRHFARFIGQKVNILEIGVHSGGSLEMWRKYFGDKCHIYGVDIEEVCKSYENEYISVFIGDQADRSFWRNFRENTEGIDILIDDGGHLPMQQQITLEEMLPYLRPGGLYFCEDIHGTFNQFSSFTFGLIDELNYVSIKPDSQGKTSGFQSSINSIHFYPYLMVIEKNPIHISKLSSIMRGSEWNHFPSK